jgi:hypothetical protein
LSVQASKLYSMGFRDPVRRSTLADANEARDWRIYAELAQRLIVQARRVYVNEDLGFDLANTVYALDSTTIDLCLAVFPWAHFRTTKAAVKMHTLLDLRGNIPSFIHVSDGKLHDVHALDLLLPEAGAIYVMDRGYVDFARLPSARSTKAAGKIRQQSGIGGDHRTAEFEHQAAVEIEPQRLAVRFTRRVPHDRSVQPAIRNWILYHNRRWRAQIRRLIRGMWVLVVTSPTAPEDARVFAAEARCPPVFPVISGGWLVA